MKTPRTRVAFWVFKVSRLFRGPLAGIVVQRHTGFGQEPRQLLAVVTVPDADEFDLEGPNPAMPSAAVVAHLQASRAKREFHSRKASHGIGVLRRHVAQRLTDARRRMKSLPFHAHVPAREETSPRAASSGVRRMGQPCREMFFGCVSARAKINYRKQRSATPSIAVRARLETGSLFCYARLRAADRSWAEESQGSGVEAARPWPMTVG